MSRIQDTADCARRFRYRSAASKFLEAERRHVAALRKWEEGQRAAVLTLVMRLAVGELAPPAVVSPPGLRLWAIAEFLCTKKTYAAVFEPLLADFRHEYFEALQQNRPWKARWMRAVYCCAFFKSAGLNVTMKLLREAWDRFQKRA